MARSIPPPVMRSTPKAGWYTWATMTQTVRLNAVIGYTYDNNGNLAREEQYNDADVAPGY